MKRLFRTVLASVLLCVAALASAQVSVNVQTFGAKGDCTTDDYAAIAKALVYLSAAGGVLDLGPKCYAIGSGISIPANVAIRGADKNATSIKWIGGNNNQVVTIPGLPTSLGGQYSALRDLTINANTATGMTGLMLVDTKRNEIRNVRIVSSVTASGIGLRMQAGAGGNGSNYNTVWNRFFNVDISGFQLGMQMDGTATTPTPVTDNSFFGLNIVTPGAIGISFAQWCDSNSFFDTHIYLGINNTMGVVFNNSATPAADVGVYNENFFHLAIDSFGVTGATGLFFNVSKQTQIDGFYHSPVTFNGTLLTDNVGRAYSYLILNNQQDGGDNRIEILSKAFYATATAVGSGAASDLSLTTSGGTQAKILHTASAVNWFQLTGGPTGSPGSVDLSAAGTDANVAVRYSAKGSASHQFFANSALQFLINNTASATNYLTVTGSNGGNPTLSASGGSINLGSAAIASAGFTATGANDTTVLTTTGGSITGAGTTSFESITGTWNTSGVVPGAIKLNVTNTASGAGSRLLELQRGGALQFGVTSGAASTGTQVRTAQATVPTITTNGGTSPACVGSDTAMACTIGTAPPAAATFTVTFNGTWAAAPSCVATRGTTGTTPTVTAAVTSTTTVVVNLSANLVASEKYNILCFGVQ